MGHLADRCYGNRIQPRHRHAQNGESFEEVAVCIWSRSRRTSLTTRAQTYLVVMSSPTTSGHGSWSTTPQRFVSLVSPCRDLVRPSQHPIRLFHRSACVDMWRRALGWHGRRPSSLRRDDCAATLPALRRPVRGNRRRRWSRRQVKSADGRALPMAFKSGEKTAVSSDLCGSRTRSHEQRTGKVVTSMSRSDRLLGFQYARTLE